MSSVDASGSITVNEFNGSNWDTPDYKFVNSGGKYHIPGSDRDDKIELVWHKDGSLTVIFNDEVAMRLDAHEAARGIEVFGGAGDDTIFVTNDTPANVDLKIHGQAGNDLLIGSDGDEFLSGNEGNDRLFGKGGNDDLHGGDGSDELHGGLGDDKLFGGYKDRAHDVYYGDGGVDQYDNQKRSGSFVVHWDIDDGVAPQAWALRENRVENGGEGAMPDDMPASSRDELTFLVPHPDGESAEVPPVEDPAPTPEPEPTPEPDDCGSDPEPEPVPPIANMGELGVAAGNVSNSSETAAQQAGLANTQADLAEQLVATGDEADADLAVNAAGQANLDANEADQAADAAEAEFERIDAFVKQLEADPDCDPADLENAKEIRAQALLDRDAARASANNAQAAADRAEAAAGIDLPAVDDADEGTPLENDATTPADDAAADDAAAPPTAAGEDEATGDTVTPSVVPDVEPAAGGEPAPADAATPADAFDPNEGYVTASEGASETGNDSKAKRKRSGNWLVALAEALGEMQAKFINKAMEDLKIMESISDTDVPTDSGAAEKQRREFLVAQSRFQANMQMFNLMAQATATTIRSIGEGNSAVARKN